LSYTRARTIEAVQDAVRRHLYTREAMLSNMKITLVGIPASALLLALTPAAVPATTPGLLCTLPPGQSKLASDALRGLAHHLRQYPDLARASPAQRRAAATLLDRLREATIRWHDVRKAAANGFDTHLAKRAPGDTAVGYLHAEHRLFSADKHVLDPQRPESLIYATEPGRRPSLVGVMFGVPRGVLGPTPGGPIDRWHSHLVCVRGEKRGLTPLANGRCPRGATLTQGSEMLHVWFTKDLRSAFAVHAPVPELCRDHLLTARACRIGARRNEM
jgi:hypothetical protein